MEGVSPRARLSREEGGKVPTARLGLQGQQVPQRVWWDRWPSER